MLDAANNRTATMPPPARQRAWLRPAMAIDAGTLGGIVLVFVLSRVLWMIVFSLGPLQLAEALCQWDCKWYAGIAQSGYSPEPHFDTFQADWAFFPGYPALMWLTSVVTRLPVVIAGTIVSNLAIVGAVWIGCRYLERTRPGQGKAPFVVLVLAGPYSFYFATVYSEALFFLLVCAAFWLWVSDRPVLSAIGGAALTATRATGVFLAVAFALDLLLRHRTRTARVLIAEPRWIVALLLVPLGLFAYMAYLYVLTGDALAFSHVQTAWYRELTIPLIWLIVGLMQFDLPKLLDPNAFSYFYSACWAIVGFGLLARLGVERRWTEFTFGLFCLLTPLSTGLTSMPRFVIGCPVLLFAAADLLAGLRWRRVALPVTLLLAIALNLLPLAAWLNGYMSAM